MTVRAHPRLAFVLAAATTAAVMATWSACGNSGTGPTPTPNPPPSLVCPSNVSLTGVAGIGQAVTYPSPVETGGTPPVTTTCTPASGATFPLGTTTVNCSAADAINRSAVCSFSVTLASSHLGAMSFVAFGDSLTAGQNGIEPNPPGYPDQYFPTCDNSATAAASRRHQAVRPLYIDLNNSYPTQLMTLLTAEFGSETFTMDNEGLPEETAAAGASRLMSGCAGQSVFAFDHPNALLLLEGINDIAQASTPYQPTSAEQQTLVGYLSSDASHAVSAGVPYIFVSTILPVKECPATSTQQCRVGSKGDPSVSLQANVSINDVNEMIRAGLPGAVIVDGNRAFTGADPTLASLLGDDGLHPTPAGYKVLAQAFMTAITGKVPITSLHRIRR